MRLTFLYLILLVLSLTKICFSEISTPNASTNSDFSPNQLHQESNNKIVQPKTKFSDLNIDVLFLICNHFNIVDLLSVFEVDTNLAFITAKLFEQKYKNYSLRISIPDLAKSNKLGCSEFKVCEIEKRIESNFFNTTLQLLTNFGHLIENIEIRNDDSLELRTISRFMNKFCYESLKHLSLTITSKDTLKEFRIPFENVADLTIAVAGVSVTSGILPLNKLFPSVKLIKLYLVSDVDYSFLACEFLSLRHLNIFVSDIAWNRRKQIEQIVRQNPQIESVKLEHPPADFVVEINQHLSNLKQLTILILDLGNHSINFEQVRHFETHGLSVRSYEKLSFLRLESLIIHYTPYFFDAWRRFFGRHKNLSSLSVTQPFTSQVIQLTELTAELEGLKELELECRDCIGGDGILQFVQGHRDLVRFKFIVVGFHETDFEVVNALRERLGGEWSFQVVTDDLTRRWNLMERKVSIQREEARLS